MIIGLTGQKQAGKTTVSKYLRDYYGFTQLNFKDELIAELKERFPELLRTILEQRSEYDNYQTIDQLFVTKPPLIRALMQNYGTEVRRKDYDKYWVKRWLDSFKNLSTKRVVTDDVRFLNEAEAIKDNGGVIIRVVRLDLDDDDQHSSETENIMIKEDFTLYSRTGEQKKLYSGVEQILKDISAD